MPKMQPKLLIDRISAFVFSTPPQPTRAEIHLVQPAPLIRSLKTRFPHIDTCTPHSRLRSHSIIDSEPLQRHRFMKRRKHCMNNKLLNEILEVRQLPSLPAVAVQVLSLVRKKETSFANI